MMTIYYKKAVQDILNNRFLNLVTIITIALSVLIISAFALFFVNAKDIMNSWKSGVRIMAYLKPGIGEAKLLDLEYKIKGMYGVATVRFISKEEALSLLKDQMKRQFSLLTNLKENPLPDAFEVRMLPSSQSLEKVEALASQLESLSFIDAVE